MSNLAARLSTLLLGLSLPEWPLSPSESEAWRAGVDALELALYRMEAHRWSAAHEALDPIGFAFRDLLTFWECAELAGLRTAIELRSYEGSTEAQP